ncbi:MAG: CopD family protein [Propionibacteriaceae bacterium]
MLSHDVVQLLFGMHRLVFYTGYVLLAGTLSFWILVWPDGNRNERLRGLAGIGAILVLICTVLAPILLVGLDDRPLAAALDPLTVVAGVLRIAGLGGAWVLLRAVRDLPVRGSRRALAVGVVLSVGISMVVQSDAVGGSWQTLKLVATAGHVLAASAWLGGLLALAAVLIPREFLVELDLLIPRFSVVATISIGTLAVTGVIHAVAVAHGIEPLLTSRYGLVLAIKMAVFGLMLVLGNHGRRYAARVAVRARRQSESQLKVSVNVHQLAVVMGAELSVAFVVLGLTSLLVMLAPHP